MQSLQKRFPQLRFVGIAFMIFLALYFLVSMVLSMVVVLAPDVLDTYWFNMINIIISQLVCMLPPVLIAMQVSKCDFTPTMRLKKGLDGIQVLIILGVSAGVFFFANGLNSIAILGLEGLGYTPMSSAVPINNIPQLIFAALLYACLPALCEELFFRGLVLRSFERYSPAVAVIMSSVLFGIMHGNVEQLFFAITAGVFLALVVMVTDSLWASMIIHFCINAAAIVFNYIGTLQPVEEPQIEVTPLAVLFSAGLWVVLGAIILLVSMVVLVFYTRSRHAKKYGNAKAEELQPGFAARLTEQTVDWRTGQMKALPVAGKNPVVAYVLIGGFVCAELLMVLLNIVSQMGLLS